MTPPVRDVGEGLCLVLWYNLNKDPIMSGVNVVSRYFLVVRENGVLGLLGHRRRVKETSIHTQDPENPKTTIPQ